MITEIDEHSCELVTGANDLAEVILWTGLLGAELTVHEPAELRRAMAEIGVWLARASRAPQTG